MEEYKDLKDPFGRDSLVAVLGSVGELRESALHRNPIVPKIVRDVAEWSSTWAASGP
jgi:hypothetical protein